MRMLRIVVIAFFIVIAPSWLRAQDNAFPLPQVPSALKTPESRANYLAVHYWDYYDFASNELIGNKDVSEQGFSNFISIMPYVSQREEAFRVLVSRMATNLRMLDYFMALAEKYLYEPLSPVYDEDLYLMMLEAVVASKSVPVSVKQEYDFDLMMAKKNRLGTKAADFTYLRRDGTKGRLWNIKGSDYILLFLGDPECDVCVKAKEKLASSAVIKDWVNTKKLAIISLCVEGKTQAWTKVSAPQGWIDACDEKLAIYDNALYEIKGLPVLYLLDGNHRVIMKNVQPEQIIRRLSSK